MPAADPIRILESALRAKNLYRPLLVNVPGVTAIDAVVSEDIDRSLRPCIRISVDPLSIEAANAYVRGVQDSIAPPVVLEVVEHGVDQPQRVVGGIDAP